LVGAEQVVALSLVFQVIEVETQRERAAEKGGGEHKPRTPGRPAGKPGNQPGRQPPLSLMFRIRAHPFRSRPCAAGRIVAGGVEVTSRRDGWGSGKEAAAGFPERPMTNKAILSPSSASLAALRAGRTALTAFSVRCCVVMASRHSACFCPFAVR